MNKPKRGIYLLPNLITMTSLFLGFFALIEAVAGRFDVASAAILVCIVLDGLDGRVARSLNIVSRFGAEFDSLTDAVVFGVVPAVTMYLWLYSDPGINPAWMKAGWLAAFFYVACTVLRLARFNSQATSYMFRGLPSPAAAALVMAFIWSWQDLAYSYQSAVVLSFVILIAAGALMVSNLSYTSFKKVDLSNKVPFIVILVLMTFLIAIAIDIPRFVLFMSLFYVLSGPTIYCLRFVRKRPRGLPTGHQDN